MSLRAFFQKPFSELILQPPPIGSRHLLFVNLFTLGMVLSLFTNKEQEIKKSLHINNAGFSIFLRLTAALINDASLAFRSKPYILLHHHA